MTHTKTILSSLLCLLLSTVALAQEPFYIHLNRANGLPSDEVYNILQDKKGFVWMTTDNGLCRYDGAEYKSYAIASMSSKSGSYLQEDILCRIWYSNFDGMIFYVENDTLKQFNTPELLSVATEFVVLKNRLFIKLRGGTLGIYDIKTLQLIKKVVISNQAFQLFKSGDYVNSYDEKSTCLFDENWNQKFCYKSETANNSVNRISRVIVYKGKFYCLKNEKNQTELIEVNGKNQTVIFEQLATEIMVHSMQLFGNEIWVCTRTGIIKINLDNHNIDRTALNNVSVSHVMKDKNGYYWASSNGTGVFVLPPQSNQFTYKTDLLNFKLKVMDNQLWLYNNAGTVSIFNESTQSFNPVFKNKTHNSIYDVVKLDLGKIKFEENNNMSQFTYQNQNYYILTGGLKEISQLEEGVFASASTGMAGIITDGNKWLLNGKHSEEYGGFVGSKTRTVAIDLRVKSTSYNQTARVVYFATNSGVYFATETLQGEITFQNNKIYASKIAIWNNRVYFYLNNGEILTLYNKVVAKESVLNSKGPYSFFKTQENQMFLCNSSQAFTVDLNKSNIELTALSFEKNTSEINDITYFKNQYFFSTYNEVTKLIGPTSAHKNETPFYINYIKSKNSIKYSNTKIEFAHNDNDILIDFSVLDFYVKNAQIEYKINSEDWKLLEGKNRKLALAALNWGEYKIVFKVNGEIQNKTVQFVISKPWYAQWWFIGLCLVSCGVVVYAIYHWRISESKKQNALLLEKVNLEKNLRQSMLSSIKSQMNPHFLFNALNTIQSFIVTEDKKNAATYLSKFSKLTRSILNMSERETITLQEELDALLLYLELEKMRFGDINYSVEIQPNINTHQILIPSMIIQPYVENSIKHGLLHKAGDKNLFIHISKTSKDLQIVIEDNGIGRAKSMLINKTKFEKHQSFATDANLKRIEILNQEKNKIGIDYEDKMDSEQTAIGTKLTIHIPLIETNND